MRLLARSRSGYRWGALAGLVVALLGGGYFYQQHTTRADYLLARGRDALEGGDWERMKRYADDLDRHGQAARAQLLLAEGWLRVGRGSDASAAPAALRHALTEVGRMQDDGPVGAEGTVLGAECLVRLGERRLAAAALEALVRRWPDDREAHRWLAAIYIDTSSPREAVIQLRHWARLDPDNGAPHRWIGFFFKDHPHPEPAIEAYRDALARRLEPASRADVVQELGGLLITNLSQYREGLDVLAGCPEAYADRPQMLALKAEALWGLGQSAEAVAAVEQALRADGNLVSALGLRGQIHIAQGQPRAAIPLLEKAARLEPFFIPARDSLIRAYQLAGDRGQAEAEQRRVEETRATRDQLTELHTAASRRPWDDVVRVQIGQLCLRVARPGEARTWLQAALACNPANDGARRLLSQIPAPGVGAGAPAMGSE